MWSLQVCHDTCLPQVASLDSRAEKLCSVSTTFSTEKYTGLIVSRPNMDDGDFEADLTAPKDPASLHHTLLALLCYAMGMAHQQGYHWLRSFNVCNG